MNLDELLMQVQKPGRYIGGEWNAVKKQWTDDKVKVLLAFPDVYEVGMSYLGMKILYGILNGRDDCLCERVFSPWTDFEDVLRKNNMELFSLESRKPIKEFDIIGFSLTYELGYTNVLNILDLGGIPKKSSERSDGDPVIIAGGPACYNPEPMAEFVDAFVIGDGEEVIGEIVGAYKGSRAETMKELAKLKGVYVPSLYDIEYNTDNTIKSFLPRASGVPGKIRKRVVENLDDAFYPTRQIVPNIQIVHDRIVIEIMRGCKHACRFCQATTTYRPCRERSRSNVLKLAKETYAMTGYDEISLLSLSSGDYFRIKDLIEELNSEFAPRAVSISVPSLRVEDVLKDLPSLISEVKKSGLTFAPEVGSERLRSIINKNIHIDKLLSASSESFKKGWRRLKLYFMIGLPTERDDEVSGIAELVKNISELKRTVDNRPANVSVSVNAFIPKPHTPFQWQAMDGMADLEKKKSLLRNSIRSKSIELEFHPFGMSYLEAILSRGDRRLAEVIYESWKDAARFDGWREFFNLGRWLGAFEKHGIDPAFYVNRARPKDEILPWDFIDLGISKGAFLKQSEVLAVEPI